MTDCLTEIEFGDLLQEAITAMERAQRRQKGDKIPNLINVLAAARVVVEFYQNKVYPPKEYPPRVCPEGDEMHNEYPFLCMCGVTAEMVEQVVERIADRNDANEGLTCFHCGIPTHDKPLPVHRHEEMWVRGPRVWGTTWHGARDH